MLLVWECVCVHCVCIASSVEALVSREVVAEIVKGVVGT